MRLQVIHRTSFTYGEPVRESFNEARLQPSSWGGQACETFELLVAPSARSSHYVDLYQNVVHLFEVPLPHRELVVTATSLVETPDLPSGPASDALVVPLDRMGACARLENCHDFLQPTTYVELSPELWRLALDVTDGCTDAWQACLAIMRAVHRDFRYVPNATQVHTRTGEVLRSRAGVCQDFAHVMIGLCRSLRIPARYVSGYLYNGPVDQLRGAQASHAWVETYLPEIGWCGLDPTNLTRPDGRYVRIGCGRDYADVTPLRGTYRGTPQRTLQVEVMVSLAGDQARERK